MPESLPSTAPELLAPAGNRECLIAAIANGADAVYFGLDHGFNARARAGNFPVEELPEVVQLLHTHGVRGYVTLNTLAFSPELDEMARTIEAVALAGVDAILVQDLGVARMARAICPELELHASTQMTMTCAETIAAALDLGLSRVVLARELSLDEIRKIKQATDIPLEVFVHGALCVAYSGQCLTSESLGGRSANRGQCAQACRLPYELVVDGQTRDLGEIQYLLSPQDLAGYALIPELVELGIASLKIEGRLKTPEYVANITRHYRQAIDSIMAGTPKRFTDQDRYEMEMSFSRGFSPGWLEGNDHKRLVPGDSSAKRGVLTGEVVLVRGNRVRVETHIPIAAGDGVVFEGDRLAGEEIGGRIFQIEKGGERQNGEVGPGTWDLLFAQENFDFDSLYPGQEMWKTDDPRLNRRLRQSFAAGPTQRTQPLDVWIEIQVGEKVRIGGTLSDNRSFEWTDDFVPELASKHPCSIEVLREQLGRLGGTPFHLHILDAKLTGTPMVPLSVLGRIRRELIERATKLAQSPRARSVRTDRWKSLLPMIEATKAPETSQLIVLCRTLEQLEEVAGWDNVVDIQCDLQDIREYRQAVSSIKDHQRLWIAPPRITKPGELGISKRVISYGSYGLLARNLAHMQLCADAARPFITDFSLNAANELTVAMLLERGAERVTTSYDLNRDQLKGLVSNCPAPRLEVVIHQHMPMFHMEHCVFCSLLSPGTNKTNCGRPCDSHLVQLRDRTGVEHPLKADVGCRNTLFNATAQSGAEAMHELMQRGVRYFRIELLDETRSEARRIFVAYSKLLAGEITGTEVWRQLQAANRLGVTRGTMESKRDPLAIL